MRALALLLVVLAGSGKRIESTAYGPVARFHGRFDEVSPPMDTSRRVLLPDGGSYGLWIPRDSKLLEYQAFAVETPDGGFHPVNAPPGARVEKLEPDAGTHAHCWHESQLQHTVTNHRDDFCCHCAAERCVHLTPPDLCGGHGPRCAQPQLDLKRPRIP